jgi:uncharacterized protein (DUF1499 family)
MKITSLTLLTLSIAFAALLTFQNLKTPTHLGLTDGQLAPMPDKPNAVSSQTELADKKVEALPFKASMEATQQAVNNALAALGNNKIQVQENGYTYSVFTSPTMRYRDDVEVYLDTEAGLVHFRSQSRAGYSDMGVNRKRYEAFRELYSNQ